MPTPNQTIDIPFRPQDDNTTSPPPPSPNLTLLHLGLNGDLDPPPPPPTTTGPPDVYLASPQPPPTGPINPNRPALETLTFRIGDDTYEIDNDNHESVTRRQPWSKKDIIGIAKWIQALYMWEHHPLQAVELGIGYAEPSLDARRPMRSCQTGEWERVGPGLWARRFRRVAGGGVEPLGDGRWRRFRFWGTE